MQASRIYENVTHVNIDHAIWQPSRTLNTVNQNPEIANTEEPLETN